LADIHVESAEPIIEESADKKLNKSLSFIDLLFLSLGGIIGSGWLFAVLKADSYAGPAVIFSWIIGGILILFIALNYAEVSGMIPRSGAIVRYPHYTHGSYTGYVLGWTYFLTAVSVPVIEAEGVVQYAASYIPGLMQTVQGQKVLVGPGILFAAALTIVFFILNYVGIKFMGRLNTVITWWKFILPIVTFILLFFLFKGSNFGSYGGFTPLGIAPIFLAVANSGIVFSFLGFRQALDYGGEAKNPQRDIPRATIYSVLIGIVIYVLLQIAFTGAINWNSLGIHAGNWAGLTASKWANAPLYSALTASGYAFFVAYAVLLLADAYVSPSGTGLVYSGTATRTIYGLAMDNYLPNFFKRINDKTGTPVIALAVATLIGWLFLIPLPSWYELVGIITSTTVLTYVMGSVSLRVFRRTAPELNRPFRLKGSAVLAPIGFIAATLIVYWSGTTTLNYIVTLVILGLPIYGWFYGPKFMGMNRVVGLIVGLIMVIAVLITAYFGPLNQNKLSFILYFVLLLVEAILYSAYTWLATERSKKHDILASAWFFVMMFGIYLISEYGGFGPFASANGSGSPIPFPLDMVIVIVFSLIIFYWAVASGYKTPEIAAIIEEETAQTPAS
jgi:amino acid transporter